VLLAGAALPLVRVSGGPAWATPVATGELAVAMQGFAEEGAFTGAVLVARGGEPLLRAGYGIADKISGALNMPDTAYQIASLTKAFTATAVMQLAVAGALSLDEPFATYLPEMTHTGRDGVEATVRHLLSHTAGVTDFFTLYDAGNPLGYPRTFDQLLADLDARELEFTPGTEQRYSNGGYTYAGLIVERLSGQPLETYLKEHILEPARMASTYILEPPDPAPPVARGYGLINGQEVAISDFSRIDLIAAAGGLTSTVDDMLRWHQALQSDLLLPGEAVATMYEPVFGTYGLGWEREFIAGRVSTGHEGTSLGFRSKLVRFLADDVVIVLLGNMLEAEVGQIAGRLARLTVAP
jgi:CubicO group peptidase (beta-lactamase class C family)